MYDYFRSVGADGAFYSYGVALFYFGEFISAPIWGKLFDRYNAVKLFSIVSTSFVFIGSYCYTIQSRFSILAGRFISGLGTGIEGALIGMLARSTISAKKAKVITILLFI